MKVSYKWLKKYFNEGDLPEQDALADLLTFHSFELEGVDTLVKDSVLDIDVLPNRSSDCLCHRGIARELSTLLDVRMKVDPLHEPLPDWPESKLLQLDIVETGLVNRFSAVVMRDVKVAPSPEWLKTALETIGQKSINNIVDATNYVMFNLGQPLHAFDSDKLTAKDDQYSIQVRNGKKGEKITTLTGEEYEVDASNLLIVDGHSDDAIGIAGVKGGKLAEVDNDTKNIILEAANFNYVSVRKTSQKLKLITDASVRFQNEPVPELTVLALRDVAALILDIADGEVEGLADWNPMQRRIRPIEVSTEECNKLLGTNLTHDDVVGILDRFGWHYDAPVTGMADFEINPPFERTDLHIKEDMIEEIGRVYGYEHVASMSLKAIGGDPQVNSTFYFAEKVRKLLVEEFGFSEVLTYTLRDHGHVELANALASDKSFMRKDLVEGIDDALSRNVYNAPLFGANQIRIFEIGTVFTKKGEVTNLCIGVRFPKKIKGTTSDDVVRDVITRIEEKLGVKTNAKPKEGIVEINFDTLVEQAGDPGVYDFPSIGAHDTEYEPFSSYPFALRDIAVWVPLGTETNLIEDIIRDHAGDLLVRHDLFDEFTKDDKTSFAFHLVFQSK